MAPKTIFFCTDCGYETSKWLGKCPACSAWGTLVESTTVTGKQPAQRPAAQSDIQPMLLDEINEDGENRLTTGFGELDRVLGGGAVTGSLILVGGEPGIGKSTLLLQICGKLAAEGKVLYASGEESATQIKIRARRLGINAPGLYILPETNIETIGERLRRLEPEILIIDSIQTMYKPGVSAAPGSISQVRECTTELMRLAKSDGITVFVIGHVNKEGAIAGPRMLEHMVDCVLYFEGDRSLTHRILRAEKNRFGSTNEIGVFEMADCGLREVPNPSELLLSGRPSGVPGSCVACVQEGTRPVLAEVQALVTSTGYGNPRRMAAGIDYNRAVLLLAVLEKRAGYQLSNRDAYINVVGGLRLDEPAADLPAVLALASSADDIPVGDRIAAFGEVGLAGELRSVTATEQRLAEIKRLGFEQCVIPARGSDKITVPKGLEIIRAGSVKEALRIVFSLGKP